MALDSAAKNDDDKGEKAGKVVEHPAAREKREKAEAAASEPEVKLIEFSGATDAATQLVKALDGEERAIARRKKIGAEYRDQIKSAEERLQSLVDDARPSALKEAGLAVGAAKEKSIKARSSAKDARASFAELASNDDGPIGKAFAKLEKLKAERATEKSKAAALVSRYAARAELVRQSMHEAAGQLRLDL